LFDRHGLEYLTGICTSCGCVQQVKYYDDDDVVLLYEKYYRDIYSSRSVVELYKDQYKAGKRIVDFLKEHKICANKVLEVGCGCGGVVKAISTGLDAEGYGVDYNKSYIEYANSNGVKASHGGFEDYIDSGEKFDLVIILHVLEHIDRPIPFMKDIAKIMSPNGRCVVEVPSIESIPEDSDGNLKKYLQNAHITHFTMSSFMDCLALSGFNVLFSNNTILSILSTDTQGEHEKVKVKGNFTNGLDILNNVENLYKHNLYKRLTFFLNLKIRQLLINAGVFSFIQGIYRKLISVKGHGQ
jgi:2-polyprenyl-3-methyl-5-hydroxy-6-metoxy-1,4-benzoquinol methylase